MIYRDTIMLKNLTHLLSIPLKFASAPCLSNLCITNRTYVKSTTSSGNFEIKVKYLLEEWCRTFRDNQIPEPRESIENILTHVFKYRQLSQNADLIVSPSVIDEVRKLCQLRLKRMPVQYIIGEWDFRDLTLRASPPVFIPRPETEMLVDIVLKRIHIKADISILDCCCGCGAIGLSLLKERPTISVTALDQSEAACTLTKQNAELHKLMHRLTIINAPIDFENEWTLGIKFDFIVSNPPYIPSSELPTLEPEITLYEDTAALDGGDNGLKIIKLILNASTRTLKAGGKLYLEVDPLHPPLINSFLNENYGLGLRYLNTYKDFCNKDRFVEIMRKE